MRSGKKRMLKINGGWEKHLRPFYKKLFWSSERKAEKNRLMMKSIKSLNKL